MSFEPPDAQPTAAPQAQSVGLRLPIAKPLVTYVLLGLIVVIFIADFLLGRAGNDIIFILGAQWNPAVASGAYWQLLTSMFLHDTSSLAHIAFNCYALYIIGRDTEGVYGSFWFALLYFVSGLAGSIAWYVFGGSEPSVGASGAIFGLIGAEAAFFLRNRKLFGAYGQQRLRTVVVLIVINAVLGFAVANINILAHAGGLVAGFLVGLFLAPAYVVEWTPQGSWESGAGSPLVAPMPRLVDTRSNRDRYLAVALAVVVLAGFLIAGNQRWGS